MNSKIFWATESNLSGVMKINAEFSEENDYNNPESFYLESIENSRLLALEVDKKVVGFLVFQILWGNTPFLALIKISRDFQRQGLGKKMINIFEKKLKKLGFKNYISSSEEINEIGKIFHKKLGFKNIGSLNMIYGKEIFFIKDL